MRVRHVRIERYRGIRSLTFAPSARTLILGPNNAGKSTILEALDLVLHPGMGRPRPAPTELDYFGRDPSLGFQIEVTLGELSKEFLAEAREHLEGWRASDEQHVPEPDGDGVEPVVRVRARGTSDFDLVHEFAKEESNGSRFPPRLRTQVGWVFDGRTREPLRQLAFYQGGLLDRLFGGVEVEPAVAALKSALASGAASVNADANVHGVLNGIANDLRGLGLLASDSPSFEVGPVSSRELLQTLQVVLPGSECQVPLFRQGRGVQRLMLVAILLRIAQSHDRPTIGGFEEPEEALEPVRQTQLSRMLISIASRGGQVFVVTHSPEIARAFAIEDFLLVEERATRVRVLRKELSPPVLQKYERVLDRAAVRALFARVPVLVEGPGDRAVIEAFWQRMSEAGSIRSAEQLGVDIVNCEGAPEMPMMARYLREAGKPVVAWAEQDVPNELKRLRDEGNCAALLLHDSTPGRQNLEQALANSAGVPALLAALELLATARGYTWDKQREYLLSTVSGVNDAARTNMKTSTSLTEFFGSLSEAKQRELIAAALAGKGVTPFEMKGARQGRLVAETISRMEGVPGPFARILRGVDEWISAGLPKGAVLSMA